MPLRVELDFILLKCVIFYAFRIETGLIYLALLGFRLLDARNLLLAIVGFLDFLPLHALLPHRAPLHPPLVGLKVDCWPLDFSLAVHGRNGEW